jgi:anti-sigma regulatory factor (Ser/Thr protein kinase)
MTTTSELRIPADPAYIVVAKRAAAAFASIAGFDVESIDDLSIAIAQACENAIRLTQRPAGSIRLTFKLEGAQFEVQVRSTCPRNLEAEAATAIRRDRESVVRQQVADVAGLALASDLALRMMGLFVDDCRYRVDERTGSLRVRLTKYRAS